MTSEIKTNDKGFVFFGSKNWNYAGDKGTWIRKNNDGSFTLQRAAKGIMSDVYTQAIDDFCKDFGVDFRYGVKAGERITFNK